MKSVSEVVACVVDNGSYVEQAVRLAREYKTVYYCVPGWVTAYPTMKEAWIGKGLENIEVVESVFEVLEETDLFVFPDTGFAPMQTWLESKGKAVWGSRYGEDMELYRDAMKVHLAEIGQPVNPWQKVVGMDKLREYLKDNPDKYVKINKWRGMAETFYAKDYRLVEPQLDEMEYRLGPYKNLLVFVVESPLPDCVELGIDGYTVDGKFPKKMIAGLEVKDRGYIGVFKEYSKLPSVVTDSYGALVPALARCHYRGSLSTENRIMEDKTSYMIDLCCRVPSPPGELCMEFYTNWSEIVWAGANGEMVDPVPAGKYGAELVMVSNWAEGNWQPIYFPEKYRQFIKLKYATKIEGRYYSIPQDTGIKEFGAIVGYGDTMKSAIKMVKEIAETVEGFELKLKTDVFDAAQEEIKKSKDMGVSYFDDKDEDEKD